MQEELLFTPPSIAGLEAAEESWTGESIELLSLDGRKITGRFLSFDAPHKRVEVELEVRDKRATVFFKLAEIKLLHLLAVKEWTADGESDARPENGFNEYADRLDFRVLFNDGKELTGRTLGFRVNSHGLCLLAIQEENTYACFWCAGPPARGKPPRCTPSWV